MAKENNNFELGPHTLSIDRRLHRINRDRLIERLRNDSDLSSISNNSIVIVLLQGGKSHNNYDTDTEPVFRQESYFHWAFGVREPEFYGAINLNDGRSFLFVPKLPASYSVWMGKLYTLEDYRNRYNVDAVFYTDQICQILKGWKTDIILTLKGINTDSQLETFEAKFDGIEEFSVNSIILHRHMAELRVFKTEEELAVIRYTNKISSEAHIEVMKSIRPGMTEYQLESIFRHYCYFNGGARNLSYTCICASGHNGAILHYGHAAAPNDRTILDGDICVFDMGCEYYCYSSDITCSFPSNGRFTSDQIMIYETVLKANRAVLKACRPGISWRDMHLLAETIILQEMIRHNLLKGDLNAMMKARLGYIFMPHGLGHLLGLDVHDVGGYLDHCPRRSEEPGLRSLRTARILEKGMVLTIEPGLYFIQAQLNTAKNDSELSEFIIWSEIERFSSFGGVRIEDNIVITEEGAELLTNVPRTVQEIETLMAEGRKRSIQFPQQAMIANGLK
ncbi:Xaa-Pro dipeptidase [Sarcoptes scabiei]|uniref:Xaa-Pro dipeptidase n=1 Tax=Sarcoptes scabiei TaxID=52283 RepID=A0A834RFG3_SARSC|nr:Xaa-Pro dipeptidase [Sarcoptes scabiei]